MTETRTFDLVYWITERYSIKFRRERGFPPPWTADPHMAYVRYCNVHREDDAVTQWIRKYWNKAGDPAWVFVLGRMLNYVPTLHYIGEEWEPWGDLSVLKSVLKTLRLRGDKVFTSAYTISTCGKSMDKIDYVARVVGEAMYREEAFPYRGDSTYESLAGMQSYIMKIDGLGSFLAAQVVADMKNTKGHPLEKAPDWWDWCAPGPGSIKGLLAFFPERNVTPSNFRANFDECRSLVDPLIPAYIPRISAQDFQSCLCEFSKFCRVQKGGHVRNTYQPKEEDNEPSI